MKNSERLKFYLNNIEKFDCEDAVWIAKPAYERSVSSRPEDLSSVFSYHFDKVFIDNEAKEYLSPREVKPSLKYKFRILDGEGNVVAAGWSSCSSSFAPLDDFFEGDAGAVEIQYYNNGKWEVL